MKFTELRYQHPATRTYLGSPSLVCLPGGDLVATHDYFGPGCPRNHEAEEHLTSLYRSHDGGRSWVNVTHIANAYWSSLFTLDDTLYLIGVSQQYGSIVIRRSTDGGNTWSHPRDEKSGLLFRGGPCRTPPNYHCAPVPILLHDGRLYRAFEDNVPGDRPRNFAAFVISAPAQADLLDAANWTMSDRLFFDPSWLPADRDAVERVNWLEGNVVCGRDGTLWNVLRLNARFTDGRSLWNKAALVRIAEDGELAFTAIVDLPGGHSKFTIRYERTRGLYLTLSNGVDDPERSTNRSLLSLYKSSDLYRWERCAVLLADDSGLPPEESARMVGFQYVDWQFDGADIIYLVRTAYGGAHNFHDANRITFHRLRDYGRLL